VVGLLLIPPVALKLGSTGHTFARYYTRNPVYVRAGPPPIVLRLVVAPALVIPTLGVFATGLELWIFGLRFGRCGSAFTRLRRWSSCSAWLTCVVNPY
jgi:hypothetical protein